MRIEAVIAVQASDTVGPTRLRLLTASSAKLPVVVVAQSDGANSYYVFDVAALQATMGGSLSATPMAEALDLQSLTAREPVAKVDARAGEVGSPVLDNGRLIGVIADDAPEQKEFTEADMARGDSTSNGDSGRKRGLFRRRS